MAIKKIIGIETEYGIISSGVTEQYVNPMTSSALLINAYLHGKRTEFDFTDETPANDARVDSNNFAAIFPETHLVNSMLVNGARYYVDHAHPEYSSPEVSNALEAVLYDRAGEEILKQSMIEAKKLLGSGEIIVYKNNTDSKGNSYGTHEGYLVQRSVEFVEIVNALTSHFVSRQIYCGSGKVGSEHSSRDAVDFQISQRADFMEEHVGLETTMKRPIVNTRDEPHADASKYRRLHVIVGDANMCDVATFLKVGTTAFILAMLEDDVDYFKSGLIHMTEPVNAIRRYSHDVSLTQTCETDKGQMSALDIQEWLLTQAKKYSENANLDNLGGQVALDVLETWEQTLNLLSNNPDQLFGKVDWITKKKIIDGYVDRDNLEATSAKLQAIDVQYHDIRKDKLFDKMRTRGEIHDLVNKDDVSVAANNPPITTRAYFRGRVLSKFAEYVHSANWDSVTLDIGDSTLKRIPTAEPTKGTIDHVKSLIDECESPKELVEKLGA
ncbi:MAG: depupylase/deamidase Dop [Acidimicrobiia bacterium]